MRVNMLLPPKSQEIELLKAGFAWSATESLLHVCSTGLKLDHRPFANPPQFDLFVKNNSARIN